MISFGFSCDNCSQPSPHFSSVPGRKFSIRMSASRQQLAKNLLSLGGLQVKRDRLLVTRLHVPPQRGAVFKLAPLAQRVADIGRFDLDDLGAEFAQQLGGKRARYQLSEFNHFQPREGRATLVVLYHGIVLIPNLGLS